MSRIIQIIIIVILSYSDSTAQAWNYVGPSDFTPYGSAIYNMGMDTANTPYVGCLNLAGQFNLMRFNGISWDTICTPHLLSNHTSAVRICYKMGPRSKPYVFATNNIIGEVWQLRDTSWELVGDSQFTIGRPKIIDMAISRNGTIYTAYTSSDQGNRVTVMKFDGSHWQILGNQFLSAGSSGSISLKCGSDNLPWVAFSDYNNAFFSPILMHYDGNNWDTVGSSTISQFPAGYVSLTLDTNDKPFVLFGTGQDLHCMNFESSNWQYLGDSSITKIATGGKPQIAADPSGIPYIAFRDSQVGQINVMWFVSGRWEYVSTPRITPHGASCNEIFIDKNGIPYVPYYDELVDKSSLIKFSSPTYLKVINESKEFSISPNPVRDHAQLIAESSLIDNIFTITDACGRFLCSQKIESRCSNIDLSVFPSGVYYIQISSLPALSTFKLIKD